MSVRTGKVYRPEFDYRGDPVGGSVTAEDFYIGDVEGIVYGAATSERLRGRTNVVSTEGMIGCTGVPLKSGDRIVVNETIKYTVIGEPKWAYSNLFSHNDFGYQWVDVESFA